MFANKKLISIIGIVVIAVVLVFIGFQVQKFTRQISSDLPIVAENTNPTTATTTPKDYSKVELPDSDSNDDNSYLIKGQPTMSPEELKAAEKAEADEEAAKGNQVEKTPTQIANDNKKVEEAQKAAESNPEVQKVDEKPVATEPATQPKADANGYIYTKDQAVKNFSAEWKKLMDTKDYNYTVALGEAKKLPNFTQEKFDADVNKMMTNPYSSTTLALFFDDYRKTGDLGVLTGQCSGWLMCGGDDAKIDDRG